jgi:hypothetical protein
LLDLYSYASLAFSKLKKDGVSLFWYRPILFFHLPSSHFIHLGGGGSPSATAVTTIRKGPMLQWRSHPNLTSYCKSDKSQCKTSPILYPADYPIEEELLGGGDCTSLMVVTTGEQIEKLSS